MTAETASRRNSVQQAIAEIAELLGDRLSTSKAVRDQHGKDTTWNPGHSPDAVAFVNNTGEVQKVVQVCARYEVPVIAHGTGTSLEGHITAPFGGICINVMNMNQVLEVNTMDFDVRVQPGVTRKQLNEYIRDQGLFFPIDPGADASLGGMTATRASGTNAVRYGTMRDNVLSLTAVMANGEIVRTARRAKKSSAGYDLTRLMVGSEGTLGIITEICLKLYGIPESIAAGVCPFPTTEAACTAAITAIQSGIPIARVELVDEENLKAFNAYSKLGLAEKPTLFVEFHGTEAYTREQVELFGEIAADLGGGPSTGPQKRKTVTSCGRRDMTAGGPSRPPCPARRRWAPTSACPFPVSPNASRKPARTLRKTDCTAPSWAMSATAISTSCCSATAPTRTKSRRPRSSSIASPCAPLPWTALAPANTASARASASSSTPNTAPALPSCAPSSRHSTPRTS
jgi:hypothetical protein